MHRTKIHSIDRVSPHYSILSKYIINTEPRAVWRGHSAESCSKLFLTMAQGMKLLFCSGLAVALIGKVWQCVYFILVSKCVLYCWCYLIAVYSVNVGIVDKCVVYCWSIRFVVYWLLVISIYIYKYVFVDVRYPTSLLLWHLC